MANIYDKEIIEEGPRNAVVKLAGVLDSSDATITPAIALSDFTNNDTGTFAGLALQIVEYAIGPGLVVQLEWNSGNPQLMVALTDSQRLKPLMVGGLLRPNMQISGYDGDINLRTRGFVVGTVQGYTVIMRLRKLYTNQ